MRLPILASVVTLLVVSPFSQPVGAVSSVLGLYQQGLQQLQSGRYRQAIAVFDQITRVDPTFAPAFSGRCAAHLALGDGRTALPQCDRALYLDPNHGFGHVVLGELKLAFGDYDEAEIEAEQALLADPKVRYPQAYNIFAEVAIERGFFRDALPDLNLAINLDSGYARAYANRGLVYAELGDQEAAIDDYAVALRLAPNTEVPESIAMGVAERLLEGVEADEDPQVALATYAQVLELDPELAAAHSGRGVVLLGQGDEEEAVAAFEQALAIDRNDVVATENLAELRPPEPEPTPEPVVAEPSRDEIYLERFRTGTAALDIGSLELNDTRLIGLAQVACSTLEVEDADEAQATTAVITGLGPDADESVARPVADVIVQEGVQVYCPES